jgi:alkylation response protein AidB-like acyl-CoA dehydrogenase
MPKMLGCLIEEMFWASNASLYLYGTLTVGASLCIDSHGTESQKESFLPKLYSGTWTGAMALTESHAGTDLGLIRTKAEPQSDGSYLVTGTKIFITSGEHDMAENIIHLVLAKLPDAPPGTKGISLFIVPKYLIEKNGNLGARNSWASGSLEHKMGIKGSATSVINYDQAHGYLLGEENQGLNAMFTMMNYERLSVGLQGLGSGDLAYQQGASYAKERVQGRSARGLQNSEGEADSLLVHADVRRMLLAQRAYNEAGRAFGLFVGMQLDLAKYKNDKQAQKFVDLLTPVAKAFLSDKGFDGAVMAQQIFGGHGYVKEWGVEQIVRDARIAQIYEGTNGVQAFDLVARKILKDGGQGMRDFVEYMRSVEFDPAYRAVLEENFVRLIAVTDGIVQRSQADPDLPGAVSTDYLELVGLICYAWLWARMSLVALNDEFGIAKKQTARFFFSRLLPKTLSLEKSISCTSEVLMDFSGESF